MLEETSPTRKSPHQCSIHPILSGTRLAASPFLSGNEREALERVAHAPKIVAAGEDLSRESELAGHFQVLIEGWACRYKTARDGRRQIVALLIPGDVANLDASLFPRLDYGVRTITATSIVAIPRDRLFALANQHSGIAKTLAWLAMSENAILSQWALCLGRQSAKERLAHLLCELNVRLGNAVDEAESHFELPLTQEQIADTLGLTAVHVNRTIQQLRVEGLIEAKGRSIAIINAEALRRVADFDPAYLHDNKNKKRSAGELT